MALDLKDIRKELKRQGWSEEQRSSGHWRFTPPDPTRQLVHYSGSPSDWRSIRNLVGELRRQGFEWPPKGKGLR
jgi:hypothetical protein